MAPRPWNSCTCNTPRCLIDAVAKEAVRHCPPYREIHDQNTDRDAASAGGAVRWIVGVNMWGPRVRYVERGLSQ
jgi:hypothetical protein